MNKKKIYIICGPTSTGKTSLALQLCKATNGVIISADSRQQYKYMDLGTGKLPVDVMQSQVRTVNKHITVGSINGSNPPTPKIQSAQHTIEKHETYWLVDNVQIWGYDLALPNKVFSAYDFVKFASNKLVELLEQPRPVFIVGGTGFYIDVLTGRATVSGVPVNLELRKSLEQLTTEELVAYLESLAPTVIDSIDTNNRHRLIRAIEIAITTGKIETDITVNANICGSAQVDSNPTIQSTVPINAINNASIYNSDANNGLLGLQSKISREQSLLEYIFIGLTSSRETLYSRSDAWVDSVWQAGICDEVAQLRDMGFESFALHGLLYKDVLRYLNKLCSKEDAIQRAKYDIHAYIRRQQTWFKRNTQIHWFDVLTDNLGQRVLDQNFKGS